MCFLSNFFVPKIPINDFKYVKDYGDWTERICLGGEESGIFYGEAYQVRPRTPLAVIFIFKIIGDQETHSIFGFYDLKLEIFDTGYKKIDWR